MVTKITPATFSKGSLGYSVLSKLLDTVRQKERLRVVWTSPDYKEVDILWGAFHFEAGEKREFIIEGGPAFCEAVMTNLRDSGGQLEVFPTGFLTSEADS